MRLGCPMRGEGGDIWLVSPKTGREGSTEDRSAAHLMISKVDHWWWLGFGRASCASAH